MNTTQVDFVTAIVYNSITGVQTYQYSYFVRNNIVGNDLNDEFKNLTEKDPCSPNPCLNGAPCSIGLIMFVFVLFHIQVLLMGIFI